MVGKMIGPVGRPLALLAMLGLVGCGLAYTVPYYSPSYFPGEERVAGTVMPVIVRGNPFAIPQAEFARDTTDAMQGWAWIAPLQFSTEANPNAAYRVAMVFNPPPGTSDYTYCIRPMPV